MVVVKEDDWKSATDPEFWAEAEEDPSASASAAAADAERDQRSAAASILRVLGDHRAPEGAPWTHLVACNDQLTWRARVTQAMDAAALYERCSEAYASNGVSVLERRLSGMLRLSVEVVLRCVPGADDTALLVHIARGFAAVWWFPEDERAEAYRRHRLACLVLREDLPAGDRGREGHLSRVWLHWPGLVVGRDQAGVAHLHVPPDLQSLLVPDGDVRAIRMRGLGTHEPMYGTPCAPDEALGLPSCCMLVRMVIDGDGQAHRNWAQWCACESQSLAAAHWCIGQGHRWNAMSATQAAHMVGLLASINPLGAPLMVRQSGDGRRAAVAGGAAIPEEQRELHDWLVMAVVALCDAAARLSAEELRRVGALLYVASGGADWGLAVWMILWGGVATGSNDSTDAVVDAVMEVDRDAKEGDHDQPPVAMRYCHHRSVPVGRQSELLGEWWALREVETAMDPQSLMLELLRDRLPPAQVRVFLDSVRAADHLERAHAVPHASAAEHVLRTMGSLTHRDLARFLHQELRCHVACVSAAGVRSGGNWYVYRPSQHRWAFDPDGTEVLRLCVRVLDREVRNLRRIVHAEASAPATAEREVRPPSGPAAGGANAGRTGSTGGGSAAGGGGGSAALAFLVNFPGDARTQMDLARTLLVHLDTVVGDVRWMHSLVRALAECCHREGFGERLDTRHPHLIPFSNGVLDLDARRLRPGRASDLVMRGPAYAWEDYGADDITLRELERMLCRIFPDTTLRDFFLRVGASILRRRNRYKHFYIFTGNTNGGKSLLLSLLKQALGPLCGQMAIAALTSREADPSGHTDYLARTHGLALVLCHEPDSGSQCLLGERIKVMTSDTDDLTVREIYGRTRDMPITWKLALVCNTPPAYQTLDAAVLARTKYVPFESSFVAPGQCAATIDGQYQQRRFPMRDIPLGEQQQLARRLMAALWAAHCANGMHRQDYCLETPPRVLMEADRHLSELQALRGYLASFLRPCSSWPNGVLSDRMHTVALGAARTIVSRHREWLAANADRFAAACPPAWEELSDGHGDRDPAVVGSPGWVRVQSVHLLRATLLQTDRNAFTGMERIADVQKAIKEGNTLCVYTDYMREVYHEHITFRVSYIDLRGVVHHFHRHQQQQRTHPGRGALHNNANTLPSARREAGAFGDPDNDAPVPAPSTPAPTPAPSTPASAPVPAPLSAGQRLLQRKQQEEQLRKQHEEELRKHYEERLQRQEERLRQQRAREQQQQQQQQQNGISLHTRMRLDPTLVIALAAETARCDIDHSHFVFGHVLLGNAGPMCDNNDSTHLMLDRALIRLNRDWFRRFRTPMPYPAVVDPAEMLESINRVSSFIDDRATQEAVRAARKQRLDAVRATVAAAMAADPGETEAQHAARVERRAREVSGLHPIDDTWYLPLDLEACDETLWGCDRIAAGAEGGAEEGDTPLPAPDWIRLRICDKPGTYSLFPTIATFPARFAVNYHQPMVPPPAWTMPDAVAATDVTPQSVANPHDANTAQMLLNAWNVFRGAKQREAANSSRILRDEYGYTGVGKHPAMVPAPDAHPVVRRRVAAENRLDWYLGEDSELSLDAVDSAASGR